LIRVRAKLPQKLNNFVTKPDRYQCSTLRLTRHHHRNIDAESRSELQIR